MFGLPDYYLHRLNFGAGDAGKLFSTWDMMSSQDGPSRTMMAWSRWLLGWLDDDQVYCKPINAIPSGATYVDLQPIDSERDGFKALMIPTSDHTGLVVEARRPVGPDVGIARWLTVGRPPEGVLVYRVDTSIGHGEGTASLIVPEGRELENVWWSDRTPPSLDALLNVGDTVNADGLSITLFTADTVRVTRPGAVPAAPSSLTATVGTRQVTLAWATPPATEPITGYRIQQSTNNGVLVTVVANTASAASKWTLSGLAAGSSYRFRVAATTATGESAYSSATIAVRV